MRKYILPFLVLGFLALVMAYNPFSYSSVYDNFNDNLIDESLWANRSIDDRSSVNETAGKIHFNHSRSGGNQGTATYNVWYRSINKSWPEYSFEYNIVGFDLSDAAGVTKGCTEFVFKVNDIELAHTHEKDQKVGACDQIDNDMPNMTSGNYSFFRNYTNNRFELWNQTSFLANVSIDNIDYPSNISFDFNIEFWGGTSTYDLVDVRLNIDDVEYLLTGKPEIQPIKIEYNNYSFSQDIVYNATIWGIDYDNITNATLHLANGDMNVIYSNFTELGGGNANESVEWDWYDISVGDHSWWVDACATDGVTVECNTNMTPQRYGYRAIDFEFNRTDLVDDLVEATCSVDKGNIDSDNLWTLNEGLSTSNINLSCYYLGYNSNSWIIDVDDGFIQVKDLDRARLELNFSDYTNITLTHLGGVVSYDSVLNISENMSDFDIGEVGIDFNLDSSGTQSYNFYNDQIHSIYDYLYLDANIDLLLNLLVLSNGVAVDGATVHVYKSSSVGQNLTNVVYTDGSGEATLNVDDDNRYKFVPSKAGYTGETRNFFVPASYSETLVLYLNADDDAYGFNTFASNCPSVVGVERNCYFYFDGYQDYENITINYNYGGNDYITPCSNDDYCATSSFPISNSTAPAYANFYLNGDFVNRTIYINWEDLSSRPIQVIFNVSDIHSDNTYLITFYVVSLIMGLIIAFSINSKIKGWGPIALILWFSVLAIIGFWVYWFVIGPVYILYIMKIGREWLHG